MNVNKIVERDGRYFVMDSTGDKNLGKKEGYASKAEADKRLKEVEHFKQKRVNVVTTINQSQVSRKGGYITIKDVVPIVDDISMNGILYPAMEINKSYESIEDTPAPIGHPMDEYGNYISAKSGKALHDYYAGVINTNVRKEDNRVLTDMVINEAQAAIHPEGMKLLSALDAKEPIHVSTGLFLNTDEREGMDVNGAAYNRVGRDFEFDHVAILFDEQGAATPAQGVGMFVNAEGNKEEVEFAHLVINSDNMDEETSKGLFASFIKWFNTNQSQPLANEEDMDLKEKMNMLKKNGKYKEGMKDEEVMNAYDKMMKDMDGKKKDDMKGNSEELAALVSNAVSTAIEPLNAKIASLEGQLATNSNKELEECADYVANSEKGKDLGMTKEMVKAMGLEAAKGLAANCGHAVGFAPATMQTNSAFKLETEAPE